MLHGASRLRLTDGRYSKPGHKIVLQNQVGGCSFKDGWKFKDYDSRE